MKKLSNAATSLWAKKGKAGALTWLSLCQHLVDTAETGRLLWRCWLAENLRNLISSDIGSPEEAEKLLVFLAAAHDLGKAIPAFQSKSRGFPPDDLDQLLMDGLQATGLPCQPHVAFVSANAIPHGLASQQLLLAACCNRELAALVGAHHGMANTAESLLEKGPQSYPMHYHMGAIGKHPWNSVQQELLQFALDMAGYPSIQDLPALGLPIQLLLCGLVIMADWIASNERLFPYLAWEDSLPELQGASRVKAAWEALALPKGWQFDDLLIEADLYGSRFGIRRPFPTQQLVLDIAEKIRRPGIFIIEAPMGTGKTEAALVVSELFAQPTKRTGLLFALPTQATSNAMFPRLYDWTQALEGLEGYAIKLAHGKAQFNQAYQALLEGSRHIGETDEDKMVHQWFEGRKKSLLADFVVSTIDQFLMAALRQKHVMLRHLGLAGKVVVLDECHAYDAYMNRYLDQALTWMGVYQVPVIILSATLPAKRRMELVYAYLGKRPQPTVIRARPGVRTVAPRPPAPWTNSRNYPLVTWTDGEQVGQQQAAQSGYSRRVNMERLQDDHLLDSLKELLRHGGYAGVIVNTVQRAQEKARQLIEAFGENQVTLVHAQFTALDRARIEEKIVAMLGKPKERLPRTGTHIVVGTQVIEQSLDLDFDVLVTDLCPMDLLLQRIGRLHRHDQLRPQGLEEARCLVLGATGEGFEAGAEAIYRPYPLMRTQAFLPNDVILLPDDIPTLVQDVYDANLPLANPPTGYEEARIDWNRHLAQQEGRAQAYLIQRPEAAHSLTDWMENPPGDALGEASVRDAADSVEVLVIQRLGEGGYSPLPATSCHQGSRHIHAYQVPDSDTALWLARQTLRLPSYLCHRHIIGQTIDELEASNKDIVAWQQSPWLKGMLFLILDEAQRTNLCGFRLRYCQQFGLLREHEGGNE